MIQENRRLWKLLLFTIPTLGIYNIYFWYRFTKDLNDMNQEEKRIKNYILWPAGSYSGLQNNQIRVVR